MNRVKVKFETDIEFRNYLIEMLGGKVEIVESDKPDYVFFESQSADRCVKYDCVRILVIGENLRPDFNLFDYAIGFDDIAFGDRYLQYPLFLGDRFRRYFEKALIKNQLVDEQKLLNRKFCNFVVRNGSDAYPIREEFYKKLCEYKLVDSAGGFLNNMDGWCVPSGELDKFRENYKFTLCFENSQYRGYITEKIVRAWSGMTVPIYWGAQDIAKYFNPKAFINVSDFDSIEEAIGHIKRIDADDELYLQMMREPILLSDSKVHDLMKEDYLQNFFVNILQENVERSERRTNRQFGWGRHYEVARRVEYEMRNNRFLNVMYRINRKIWGYLK